MNINSLIRETSARTPDPERALKNLERLFTYVPEFLEENEQQIETVARLFSYSQFLAEYCIKDPIRLSSALKNIHRPIKKQEIISQARKKYKVPVKKSSDSFKQEAMRILREIKKSYLLRITINDISGIISLNECMSELSILSEAILEVSLNISYFLMREKFGDLKSDSFSIIGLGKLGAGELNYSSDIDIISVYNLDECMSSGILTPSGIRVNKIYSHEYFCRLTEILTGLLQSPTEDGIAYRVDLRLRPNGQKGAISLSLDSYVSYYESWGKTWERMALIRARHAAGDELSGRMFISAIEPFIWKRSIDYNDIEEIKELKKKVDIIFDVDDIKRGYGGIREIEFFVQTFQLLHGGDRKNLRTGTLTTALEELSKEGILSKEDVRTLSESYLFLRRLEHILQMKDDLQTHSLPSKPEEIVILSKKMLFNNEKDFTSELRLKRLMVRDMYISLLGGAEIQHEVMAFLEGELTSSATMDYLSFKGFKNPDSAFKDVKALHEQMSLGKTLRERTLLRKTIPLFFEHITKSGNKDRALSMLVTFLEKIGIHESYIDLLLQRSDTREILITTFSTSIYFTRLLLSLENLEGIFEYPDIRMDYKSVQERLVNILKDNPEPMNAIREIKSIEELKSGLLFMKGAIDVYGFSHALSMLADRIIRAILKYLHAERDFAVIGLGGFGARELNIGSDLDLIFISTQRQHSPHEIPFKEKGVAEELIKLLSEYTAKGFAYKVDMRLRPDGSSGILVNDIDGCKNYYLKSAHLWEIQSLLRARPIAGNMNLLKAFQYLKSQVIMKRGKEISGSYIKEMRKRIIHEVSKESSGYDMKLGPGGIKEIEFLIQYLQLKHGSSQSELLIHNTVTAIKRLSQYAILDVDTGKHLLHAYRFLRTVDTLLRLNEEDALSIDSELIDIIIRFVNMKSKDILITQIQDMRQKMLEIATRFYEQDPHRDIHTPD
jgi:glutamate-ammonia-ligase adenylyltransferase